MTPTTSRLEAAPPYLFAGASSHRAAVANTLREADAAASDGDLRAALSWLETVEAIGDRLPPVYADRRRAWRSELAARSRDRA